MSECVCVCLCMDSQDTFLHFCNTYFLYTVCVVEMEHNVTVHFLNFQTQKICSENLGTLQYTTDKSVCILVLLYYYFQICPLFFIIEFYSLFFVIKELNLYV